MRTGVTLLCRQRLCYHHILFLVFIQLHDCSSSAHRSAQGCIDYPEVCRGVTDVRNNCSSTLKDQRCHYSRNNSLQQSDLLSLFGKHDNLPESPKDFSIGVTYIKDVEQDFPCIPSLKFSWKISFDEKSTKRLTGFVLNVSYTYNNRNRQTVRIFSVEDKLLNDASFQYECFIAITGVSYRATIYSLPTNLQNMVTQTVSVNCFDPNVRRGIKWYWTTTMEASVLRNGSVSVYFMPAPINFNFSAYSVWLSTKNAETYCEKMNNFFPERIAILCPEQGRTLLNSTGLDVHEEYRVCIQPQGCVSCSFSTRDVSLIVATAEDTTTTTTMTTTTTKTNTTTTKTTMSTGYGNVMKVNVPTTFSADDTSSLPDGAIVIGLLVGLLLFVVFSVLILSVRRINRLRCHRQKKDLNATKKYTLLIYGNDVKLNYVDVIDRLSAFLELCNKCEVISIDDGCSNVQVLKRRIALADSVLIIRSAADAVSRYATCSVERKDSGYYSESTPVDDMFHSAIEIIQREFQSEVTYMKFCQIMLPCCQDGSGEVGLPDLKVKKTYKLMEFIQELWGNNQTMSCISDSNADDFRKCNEVFKELERISGNTNCCRSCMNKTFRHNNNERNEYKQSFNDSGVTVDDSSTYFLAEGQLTQCCCAGLGDTKAQMARNSPCHYMCRSVDRINCSLLEVETHHENNLESTMRCKLWQCSKKEIDSEDCFFFESRNSSSESISLSTFLSNAVKFNDEFDRNLEADGIDSQT